jgi:hypothetical protein
MDTRKIMGWVVGAALVSGTVAVAGQAPTAELTLSRRVAMLAARVRLGGGASPRVGEPTVRVVGFAWREDDTPLEHPQLRIRDLKDGQVSARTTGTALGEFRFEGLAGGLFLIELVDADDHVLAVGQPLAVLAGETVGTLFDSNAESITETANEAEVTALGGARAASNER